GVDRGLLIETGRHRPGGAAGREPDEDRTGAGQRASDRREGLLLIGRRTVLLIIDPEDRQVTVAIAGAAAARGVDAEGARGPADVEADGPAGLLPHRRLVGPGVDRAAAADPSGLRGRRWGAQDDGVVAESGVGVTQRGE